MERKSIEELAADIKVIRELASSGTMLQDITEQLGVTEEYVSAIMLCLQGYGGDDDNLAVARLVEMSL